MIQRKIQHLLLGTDRTARQKLLRLLSCETVPGIELELPALRLHSRLFDSYAERLRQDTALYGSEDAARENQAAWERRLKQRFYDLNQQARAWNLPAVFSDCSDLDRCLWEYWEWMRHIPPQEMDAFFHNVRPGEPIDLHACHERFMHRIGSGDAAPGSVIAFGRLPFLHADTREPMRWLVLEQEGDTALLLSLYALCELAYDEDPHTLWPESALRKWLQTDFVCNAFTPAEQACLLPCELWPGVTDTVFVPIRDMAMQSFPDGHPALAILRPCISRDIRFDLREWFVLVPPTREDHPPLHPMCMTEYGPLPLGSQSAVSAVRPALRVDLNLLRKELPL